MTDHNLPGPPPETAASAFSASSGGKILLDPGSTRSDEICPSRLPTMTATAELLPCPFCGGWAKLLGPREDTTVYDRFIVECQQCEVFVGGDHAIEAIAAWNTRLAAVAVKAGEGEKLERDYTCERLHELLDEGGSWRVCSGCQESDDGYVSTKYYPYSALFRCQPGSGCTECGGIGVLWEAPGFWDGYGDDLTDAALAPPATDPVVKKSLTTDDPTVAALVEALKTALQGMMGWQAHYEGCDLGEMPDGDSGRCTCGMKQDEDRAYRALEEADRFALPTEKAR